MDLRYLDGEKPEAHVHSKKTPEGGKGVSIVLHDKGCATPKGEWL